MSAGPRTPRSLRRVRIVSSDSGAYCLPLITMLDRMRWIRPGSPSTIPASESRSRTMWLAASGSSAHTASTTSETLTATDSTRLLLESMRLASSRLPMTTSRRSAELSIVSMRISRDSSSSSTSSIFMLDTAALMLASGVRRSCDTAVSTALPTRLPASRAAVARRMAAISSMSISARMREPCAAIMAVSAAVSSRPLSTKRRSSPEVTLVIGSSEGQGSDRPCSAVVTIGSHFLRSEE